MEDQNQVKEFQIKVGVRYTGGAEDGCGRPGARPIGKGDAMLEGSD